MSFQMQVVGEGAKKDVLGARPFGRLILTPEHTMAVYISSGNRKPPTTDSDRSALFSTMIAYTGRYSFDGERLITTVDGAWSEVFKAKPQVRFVSLRGEELTLSQPDQPSGLFPGKRVAAVLVWERER